MLVENCAGVAKAISALPPPRRMIMGEACGGEVEWCVSNRGVAETEPAARRQFLGDLVVEIGKANLAAASGRCCDRRRACRARAARTARRPGARISAEIRSRRAHKTCARQLAAEAASISPGWLERAVGDCTVLAPELEKVLRRSFALEPSTRPSGVRLEDAEGRAPGAISVTGIGLKKNPPRVGEGCRMKASCCSSVTGGRGKTRMPCRLNAAAISAQTRHHGPSDRRRDFGARVGL